MEQKLKDIKLILSGLMYSRDIEDIVFNNNGQKNTDPNKCHGKRVIDGYNSQVLNENMNNLKQFGKKTNLDNETFVIDDTKHFCIGWIKPRDKNSVGYNVMTFYFKEIIIIETTQNCLQPIPPKYVAFRHYFTPDILLLLKHFHKTPLTENAMEYVRQNPHYFKHHTMNTHTIINNLYDKIEEIDIFYIAKLKKKKETIKSLRQMELELKNRAFELEIENQNLKTKIVEIEKIAKRS